MKKISIIVPIYNVEPYLRRCLESISNQSFNDFEVIMVDDGSTDGSSKIVDEYARNDERFIAIHQENAGLSQARNVGVENSCGEFLMFLDSDDYFEEEIIKESLLKIENENADILVFGFKTFDENNEICGEWLPSNTTSTSLSNCPELILNVHSCVWSKMYRRYLFDNLHFVKDAWYEDYGITSSLMIRSRKIAFLNKYGVCYFVKRKGSITSTYDSRINWIIKMSYQIIDDFKKNNKFDEYENVLKKLIEREVMNCILMRFTYTEKANFFREFLKNAYKLFDSIAPNVNTRKFPYRNFYTAKSFFIIRGLW